MAEVETVEPDPNGDVADLPPGSLLDVEPALGTPIEIGGHGESHRDAGGFRQVTSGPRSGGIEE